MFRLRSAGAVALLCVLLPLVSVPAEATFTKMRDFSNKYLDGAHPVGQLAAIGSTLYGVTQSGTGGYGSLYKMTTAGATTPLAEFTGALGGPRTPTSGLIAAGGVLYGTTSAGGVNNFGTVYKATTAGAITPVF